MSEFDDKLQSLFSSPDALEQVMSIAKGLMGDSDSKAEPAATPVETRPESGAPDLSLLSGLDPKLISLAMSVFGEYSKDDRDVHLLHALKPHLRTGGRGERVDHAIQILKLSKAVRAAMRGFGGGAENV